ncbi:MAG TPA: HD domain-containing phosphohydrolase [Bryobacteraceae bacterium]|nr:HD domain-containing phosphohydrolase [Bryobacteraceae bacterium]
MTEERSQRLRARLAAIHVYAYVALGCAALASGLANWHWNDPVRFASFLLAAALGSILKVRLPGVTGNTSVSALFVLIGIVNLSLPEALIVGAVSMLVQCTWRPKVKPRAIQVAFSVCVLAIAIYVSAFVLAWANTRFPAPLSLTVLALVYFCLNTFPIAAIIGLTEGKAALSVWSIYRWTLAYYLVGASMAWVIGTIPRSIQWEFPIICLPLVYLVHRSNRTYLRQMEQVNQHMQDMNALHLRTIEALALAIDAKDHTTHDHLQRVQLYAIEIGKDLGLGEQELDALRAAAVLHDIGKLAVPESIISKPGKLTRSEFEKMKIHPVVGAEILERVEFPYPVVPIVRAHHEKWDGSGYPYGLKGNEIPIGSRILAAVDCLDALASDRQYRRALPLEEAMARVESEGGTSFDPAVVRALKARYRELEARAKAATPAAPQPSLSVDIKITRGSAPAAGFEAEPLPSHPVSRARARQKAGQSAVENLAAGLDTLPWDEAFAVAAVRIQRIVAYDAIAFYSCEETSVRTAYVDGRDRGQFESPVVPHGEGLIGWVAATGKAMLNGNPAVEAGHTSEGAFGSALALPLTNAGTMTSIVALYRRERDAFAADELIALLEVCPALATLLSQEPEPAAGDLPLAAAG